MNSIVKRSLKAVALLLGLTLIATSGCKRPENEIGLQLQPQDDILHAAAVDTFTVRAFTVPDDSIRTDKVNPAMIGAYLDPVFGEVKSSHITELRLSSVNPNFVSAGSTIEDVVVDSLVLVMRYATPGSFEERQAYYGNGLGQQYFQVFEISDSLAVDSTYYEYTSVNTIGNDLVKEGGNYQEPKPSSAVIVGGDTLPPQMRIPLDEALGYRFIEASIDGELSSTDFISLFRGILITVDETNSNLNNTGLIYFDTFSGDSQIIMYYQNTQSGADSLKYSFVIRNQTAKYNKPEHDYKYAVQSIREQLAGNFESAKQDLYVQAAAGLKLIIELPYIQNLADSSGIAINKAMLILPARVVSGAASLGELERPNQLYIFGRKADGSIYPLSDDNANSNSGIYDETTDSYRFVISRYLQQILLGNRENHGLEIVAAAAGRSANRVVINGTEYPNPENPSNNLKLAITFTKY